MNDVSMDIVPDYATDQDDVVRWVPSQSPNPALQALMREAERERGVRLSTYVEPSSWARTLPSTDSTSVVWVPSTRTSSLPSLSTSTSSDFSPPSASLSSSVTHAHARGSEDSPSSTSRQGKASSYNHVHPKRKPLSASTSSANQAVRVSRPRSSSHSASAPTIAKNSVESHSKRKIPDDDPNAAAFLALLRDVSRQVDENSRKKQRVAAKVRERERGHRDDITTSSNILTTVNTPDASRNAANSRTFIKTSVVSAISGASTSTSSRVLTRTTSLGASTNSTIVTCSANGTVALDSSSIALPTSAPRILSKTSSVPNVTPHLTSKPPRGGGERDHGRGIKGLDDKMKNTTGNSLADIATHFEDGWDGNEDRAMCVDTSTAELLTSNDEKGREESCMQVDVVASKNDADMAMDVSFCQSPRALAPPKITPKSKLTVPPSPTQRLPSQRPPPLGMRRPALLSGASQSLGFPGSQYSLSQTSGTKGTVPKFKPPLLSETCGNKPSGTSHGLSSKTDPPSRRTSNRPVFNAESKVRSTRLNGDDARVSKGDMISIPQQDPDSSFDVSFDVDADALEETMRAYD
ncbi:hypothetical protein F5I97DRAFT_2019457 [Phlebopus sp. FC_14]|nr:hypothetical protein F5I97DRAFT_2019457 [Phlebopus sp. FC_14]